MPGNRIIGSKSVCDVLLAVVFCSTVVVGLAHICIDWFAITCTACEWSFVFIGFTLLERSLNLLFTSSWSFCWLLQCYVSMRPSSTRSLHLPRRYTDWIWGYVGIRLRLTVLEHIRSEVLLFGARPRSMIVICWLILEEKQPPKNKSYQKPQNARSSVLGP